MNYLTFKQKIDTVFENLYRIGYQDYTDGINVGYRAAFYPLSEPTTLLMSLFDLYYTETSINESLVKNWSINGKLDPDIVDLLDQLFQIV